MNNRTTIQKISLAGILIAIGVILSFFNIPVGAAKCFPIQHMVNVIAAVTLGPVYALGCAFVTSLIRVSTGAGTLLAFPGSMCGALLAGVCYKYSKKISFAMIGEIIGTGIIGALIAYPIAAFILGKEVATFAFIIPFMISTVGGSIIAGILLKSISKVKGIDIK